MKDCIQCYIHCLHFHNLYNTLCSVQIVLLLSYVLEATKSVWYIWNAALFQIGVKLKVLAGPRNPVHDKQLFYYLC